jgi:CheY-like chemotaxis protein
VPAMDGFAKIIEALTKLGALIVVTTFVWKLFSNLVAFITSRAFSIKVAGMELTVQEATQKLQRSVEDLQNEVIRSRILENEGAKRSSAQPVDVTVKQRPRRILWVDDVPANIAMEISQLNSNDIDIVSVKSTDEAVKLLEYDKNFSAIVSDMVRRENGSNNKIAGIVLLRAIRKMGLTLPFYVFSSGKSEAEFEQIVAAEGGDGITSSSLRLLEWVTEAVIG